jgi:hypothetical protein
MWQGQSRGGKAPSNGATGNLPESALMMVVKMSHDFQNDTLSTNFGL